MGLLSKYVKVKWHSGNKKHFGSKGYIFTKIGDEFEVEVNNLPKGSTVKVLCNCDNPNCSNTFLRKYNSYLRANKQSYCSKSCAQNPEKRRLYTNDSLINDFWKYYKEYKKFPMSDDFKHNTNYPDLNTIKRYFGSWLKYLKEVGVVDKDNTDGWYIHDEALIRKYYPSNQLEKIIRELMIKRTPLTIRDKASKMGISVLKEFHYIPKYKNKIIKNKLIDEAIEFYKRNNRSPFRYELSLPKKAIEQNWNSYNEFLNECELPLFRRYVSLKTKEDGILFLNNLKELLGRNPYVTDLDKYGLNKNWFSRTFGSYKSALFEANLIKEDEFNEQLKIDKSIEGLKQLYENLSKVPNYIEYEKYASENILFSPNALMSKLNYKSYNEMCNEILGESNRIIYDEIDLIQNLFELKETLGRPPMGKELVEYGYPSISVYKTFFNKRYFNDIIRDLGWEPSGHDSLYKSDEELLNDYLKLYNKLGRIPLRDDIDETESMCCSPTYLARFDSLANICELLDLNYNEFFTDSQMGIGTSCFDNNGEICRSIAEMKITNILIKYNIKYIKEYPYKNISNNELDKRRFDWYLPNYNIYIEYFGLFNKSQLNKDNYAGIYTRKTLKKIDDCKNLNIYLIELYLKDYKNKFKKFESNILNLIKSKNTNTKVI